MIESTDRTQIECQGQEGSTPGAMNADCHGESCNAGYAIATTLRDDLAQILGYDPNVDRNDNPSDKDDFALVYRCDNDLLCGDTGRANLRVWECGDHYVARIGVGNEQYWYTQVVSEDAAIAMFMEAICDGLTSLERICVHLQYIGEVPAVTKPGKDHYYVIEQVAKYDRQGEINIIGEYKTYGKAVAAATAAKNRHRHPSGLIELPYGVSGFTYYVVEGEE